MIVSDFGDGIKIISAIRITDGARQNTSGAFSSVTTDILHAPFHHVHNSSPRQTPYRALEEVTGHYCSAQASASRHLAWTTRVAATLVLHFLCTPMSATAPGQPRSELRDSGCPRIYNGAIASDSTPSSSKPISQFQLLPPLNGMRRVLKPCALQVSSHKPCPLIPAARSTTAILLSMLQDIQDMEVLATTLLLCNRSEPPTRSGVERMWRKRPSARNRTVVYEMLTPRRPLGGMAGQGC